MPLNADGERGYGSVNAGSGAGLAGNLGRAETVPLLMPEPEPEPEPFRWKSLSREELETPLYSYYNVVVCDWKSQFGQCEYISVP